MCLCRTLVLPTLKLNPRNPKEQSGKRRHAKSVLFNATFQNSKFAKRIYLDEYMQGGFLLILTPLSTSLSIYSRTLVLNT